MALAQLTANAPRLALVGLAKNTGKTVTLNALLGELATARTPVGVTSVGRDGERNDVIDFRIEKPLVRLAAGDLVATTDTLLAASGVPHELLEHTGVRTPMGEVLLARLNGAGTVEIAGPSAALDTRAVADSMLAQGAERVVIDGAIDRRAASSPEVSDGLVMSTGAILSEDPDEVLARTVEAVALVRLPALGTEGQDALARELAAALAPNVSALAGEDARPHPLPERFVLTAEPTDIAERLRAAGAPSGCSSQARCHSGSWTASCPRCGEPGVRSRSSSQTPRACSSPTAASSTTPVPVSSCACCVRSTCSR